MNVQGGFEDSNAAGEKCEFEMRLGNDVVAVLGVQDFGFRKKAAAEQRKGLSVNFNFLGFEEEQHEFEPIGAVNVKEFTNKA